MSDDAQQEYFADGMSEDLITDISEVPGLFVIARNSVFTYKDKAVNVRQVAEELGVRYVMGGRVRRVGEQVIIVPAESQRFKNIVQLRTDYDERVDDGEIPWRLPCKKVLLACPGCFLSIDDLCRVGC